MTVGHPFCDIIGTLIGIQITAIRGRYSAPIWTVTAREDVSTMSAGLRQSCPIKSLSSVLTYGNHFLIMCRLSTWSIMRLDHSVLIWERCQRGHMAWTSNLLLTVYCFAGLASRQPKNESQVLMVIYINQSIMRLTDDVENKSLLFFLCCMLATVHCKCLTDPTFTVWWKPVGCLASYHCPTPSGNSFLGITIL